MTTDRAVCRGGFMPPRLCRLGARCCIGVAALFGSSWASAQDPYAVRTVWDQYTQSDLNISVFVFRDANRNGVYDLPDRPMSGIQVDSSGVGQPGLATSNSSGFANFVMSGTERSADIQFEGQYQFDVAVPPHWTLTTGNQHQSTHFSLFPGSPADMVAQPAPSIVGLTPDLSINLDLPPSPEPVALTARFVGAVKQTLSTTAGSFSFPAQPGNWEISSPLMPAPRQIAVGQTPVRLTRAWLLDAAPDDHLPATQASFDNLQSEGVLKIPSGYVGLNWSNFVMAHRKFYDPEGYRNGTMSGEFLAYNGSGHPAAISRDEPFDFLGGYFAASTLRAEGETLIITGWQRDQQVYSESLPLSALGPIYLAADFRGVTRLEFHTAHFWQFTADDLAFRL